MGSIDQEKALLPQTTPVEQDEQVVQPASNSKRTRLYRLSAAFVAAWLLIHFYLAPSFFPSCSGLRHKHHDKPSATCAQAEPVLPKSFDVSAIVEGNERRIQEWMSGAVKIPTEIFDVMGPVGEDPRWDVFYQFSDYLEKAYPLVHKHLTRTRVKTHALVFEWQGSDPSLKPLMLAGHQDVVPVLNATRNLWTHDPFGGEYEESTGRIWGRGSSDDKSGVIGALSAFELLLESGKFNPARTVVLALGCDEETGGKGAYHLAQWIEAKYGQDSMAMLVDEGSGVSDVWGQKFAVPAVAEKGYLDVEIRVETPGGHSSVPPTHTGIGIISLLIAQLEKNPHQPHLNPESPVVAYTSCAADYAPEIPGRLKRAIRRVEASLKFKKNKKHARVDKRALKEVEDWWVKGSVEDGTFPEGAGKALVSTTQATDIINGGVKVNALPEVVTAIVNHRINVASSVGELQEHLIKTLKPTASRYNVALEAFGKDIELEGCPMHLAQPKVGKIILSEAFHSALEPAPISPHTIEDPAWRVLAGTIKGVYATRPGANATAEEAKKVMQVAPMIMGGNTDTKRYWNLTRNIYRFAYLDQSGAGGIHTVDEYISAAVLCEEVRWFANFIVNVDETREI